nr:hypothetical protein [Tanacetum cinerariifolium]
DPYEAIRHAYLLRMDTESEPFEVEAETPESPHIVAPPTCHVEESKGSCTFGVRSTTARTAVRVPPVMLPGLSAGIAVVATMFDSTFHKSEDVKDEGLAAGDEGLPTRDEGPDMRVKSCGLNDEGHRVESDGLGLREEDEAVHEGQQQAAVVVGITMSSHLGLGYRELRHRELALGEDHVYSTFEVGQGSGSAPESERSDRIDRDVRELYTRSGAVKDEIFSQRYQFKCLEHKQERTAVTFRALWRSVLALEAWAGHVDTWMIDMS